MIFDGWFSTVLHKTYVVGVFIEKYRKISLNYHKVTLWKYKVSFASSCIKILSILLSPCILLFFILSSYVVFNLSEK